MTAPPTAAEVVRFWREAGRRTWFRADAQFDEMIRTRFESLHLGASRCELAGWGESPDGALALVLLFDQFPRHIYRGSAHAFATDPLARDVADTAIAAGFDLAMTPDLQPFFYLPFEHHEDPASQTRSLELFGRHTERTGETDYLRYARLHAELIDRFGRFPHRNRVLGRRSTPAEIKYVASGGFRA